MFYPVPRVDRHDPVIACAIVVAGLVLLGATFVLGG